MTLCKKIGRHARATPKVLAIYNHVNSKGLACRDEQVSVQNVVIAWRNIAHLTVCITSL